MLKCKNATELLQIEQKAKESGVNHYLLKKEIALPIRKKKKENKPIE